MGLQTGAKLLKRNQKEERRKFNRKVWDAMKKEERRLRALQCAPLNKDVITENIKDRLSGASLRREAKLLHSTLTQRYDYSMPLPPNDLDELERYVKLLRRELKRSATVERRAGGA